MTGNYILYIRLGSFVLGFITSIFAEYAGIEMNHRNPIPDIIEELAINHDHRNCKPDCVAGEVFRESMQALYEAIVASLPQKYDTTHNYSDRLARNKALDEALTNLRALFGVDDGESLKRTGGSKFNPRRAGISKEGDSV